MPSSGSARATFGLFTRLGGPRSALASLSAGVGIWVIGNYVLGLPWAYLAAPGASVAAYALGAVFERGPESGSRFSGANQAAVGA